MRVRYLHEFSLGGKEKACSNIMWEQEGRWPMKAGEFPNDHPCLKYAEGLGTFLMRGYSVSPFPEGDGVTMSLKSGQSSEQVVKDIEECLGWKVVLRVDEPGTSHRS